MTDGTVATRVELATGEEVAFQDYFVRLRHAVPVRAVRFAGSAGARPTAEVLDALEQRRRDRDRPVEPDRVDRSRPRPARASRRCWPRRRDQVVAVSPIVGGAALKGPADRLLAELGHEPSVVGVARLYAPIASTLVIDPADAVLAPEVEAAGMRALVVPSVMTDAATAAALAAATLSAAR